MDNRTAASIMDALANGREPFNGRALPADSFLQNPEVVRALFLATRALEERDESRSDQKPQAEAKPRGYSPGKENAGKAWTEAEDKELTARCESDMSDSEIAKAHGRSRLAIQSRLNKLGLIDADGKRKRLPVEVRVAAEAPVPAAGEEPTA